jgi:hypothetical protein
VRGGHGERRDNEGIDRKAPNYQSVAASLRADGANCFVFSGITANGAVQLYKDVHAAMPDINLYGPDGVAESGFADPAEGGIPPEVQAKTRVTVATLAPDEYPPQGQKFFAEYERRYGEEDPDPLSRRPAALGIYGVGLVDVEDVVLDTVAVDAGEGCVQPRPPAVRAGRYPLAEPLRMRPKSGVSRTTRRSARSRPSPPVTVRVKSSVAEWPETGASRRTGRSGREGSSCE